MDIIILTVIRMTVWQKVKKVKQSRFKILDRVKRIWYLSPMRAAKVQASLRIRLARTFAAR